LFCNAQRNRLKVLVWDGSGLWVCAKRLEKGRFTWPQSGDAQGKVVLSHEELALLLGGIDLAKTKHKRWLCAVVRLSAPASCRVMLDPMLRVD
jgi:transposase